MAQQNDGSLEAGRRLYSVHDVRHRYVWFLRTILASLWLSFVGMFAAMAIADWIRPFRPQDPLTEYVVMGILAPFVGSLLVVLVATHRRSGIVCPSCGKRIDPPEFNLAIAIHACPHCKGALFQQWPVISFASIPSTVAMSQLMTLADIRQLLKTQSRHFRVSVLKTALTAAATLGMTRLCIPVVLEQLDLPTEILAGPIGLVAAAIVMAVGMVWLMRHSAAKYSPRCPYCADEVFDCQILRLTGNCPNCGCRILRGPGFIETQVEEQPTPLLSRSTYNAAVDRYLPQMVWLILWVFGSAAVCLCLVSWSFGYRPNSEVLFREAALAYSGIFLWIAVLGGCEAWMKRSFCCPNCGNTLLQNQSLIRATGNCAGCGRCVLEPTHVNAKS